MNDTAVIGIDDINSDDSELFASHCEILSNLIGSEPMDCEFALYGKADLFIEVESRIRIEAYVLCDQVQEPAEVWRVLDNGMKKKHHVVLSNGMIDQQ